MARLLLVLTDNGSEFHKTDAAWAKARSPSEEQLAFGTKRRDWAEIDQNTYLDFSKPKIVIYTSIYPASKQSLALPFE